MAEFAITMKGSIMDIIIGLTNLSKLLNLTHDTNDCHKTRRVTDIDTLEAFGDWSLVFYLSFVICHCLHVLLGPQ